MTTTKRRQVVQDVAERIDALVRELAFRLDKTGLTKHEMDLLASCKASLSKAWEHADGLHTSLCVMSLEEAK